MSRCLLRSSITRLKSIRCSALQPTKLYMRNIARRVLQLLKSRSYSSSAARVPQSSEFCISLHNAAAVKLKGRQPWAAVHCSDSITNIALCGESSSLVTLHYNGAVRLWSLDGEVPREADGSLDCLRSRAHYLETEVIPVHTSIIHDGSALHADAAPRVLVLQPSNLTLWGSKKFELQPATSVSRSHGVFHDRIKTLYTVFESSKKGVDLQMTACLPDINVQIVADAPPATPAQAVFTQLIAPSGCSSALALRRDGCVMAVPVPEKLDIIDQDQSTAEHNPLDIGMKLPLFSLLAVEGGTGRMCAIPGTSIVAIAGKDLRGNNWIVHLVDADKLLPLNSAPLLIPFPGPSSFCIIALNAQAIDDGTVHVAAALLHTDGKVAWAEASISSNGTPLSRHAARPSSMVFQLGNSVAEAQRMGDGSTHVLLEDDGRVRVKQVVSNSLIHAALLEGNLLLAWRAREM